MVLCACSLLMRQKTNKRNAPGLSRIGGWSEGWWFEGDPADAMDKLVLISQFRARFLTDAASVIGQRVRVVGGGSTTNNRGFPGGQTIRGDIPQMGLLCTVQGVGRPNVRHFILRGVPDARVEEGEFDLNDDFLILVRSYVQQVGTQQFAFKCNDLTQPTAPVLSIADDGSVVFMRSVAFTNNALVQGLRVVSDDTGRAVSFTLPIQTGIDSLHYKLLGWTHGPCSGGKIRADATVYPIVDGSKFAPVRITTHKVGKDFFQYRGRASARN